LALFLIHLGYLAGLRIHVIKETGAGLFTFALIFPFIAGTIGVVSGHLAGLSVGGATILGVLAASASYIAAPAAVRVALPEANISLPVTTSLVITFPVNLLISIPLLTLFAQRF